MRIPLLALLLVSLSCAAAGRVTDFHSDIRIARSGELAVTERFTLEAQGTQVKREFPLHAPLRIERVTRNGAPEPYAVERLGDATRVRIGSADATLPPGPHTYEIAYRAGRQLGFFDEHDELYWPVNGYGWALAFDRITAEVHLPQQIAASLVRAEAYTGMQGARGRSYAVFVRDGGAAFRSTRVFQPREGMTVLVAFPKGLVDEPGRAQRVLWFLGDHRAVAVGMAGAVLLFCFLYWCWSTGRKAAGSILAGLAAAIGILFAMHRLGAPPAVSIAVGGVMALTLLLFTRWMLRRSSESVAGERVAGPVEDTGEARR